MKRKDGNVIILSGLLICCFIFIGSVISANAATGSVKNLFSSSHQINTPSQSTTVNMEWTAPDGGGSLIYFCIFNTQYPYSIEDNEGTGDHIISETTTFSSDLSNNDDVRYYFHVAAYDMDAMTYGPTSSYGPIRIDNTAPTNVYISAPSTTAKQTVLLSLGGNDIYQMYISNSGYESGGSWEPFVSTKNWSLDSNQGTKTIYVSFKDLAGNKSQKSTQIVYYQNIAPSITDCPNQIAYLNTPKIIPFQLSDSNGHAVTLTISSSNADLIANNSSSISITNSSNQTVSGLSYNLTPSVSTPSYLTLTVTPQSNQTGQTTLSLLAKDIEGLTSLKTISLVIFESQFTTSQTGIQKNGTTQTLSSTNGSLALSTTSFNNNGYIFAGANSFALTSTSATSSINGYSRVLARTWSVAASNIGLPSTTTFTFTIDAKPTQYSDYVMGLCSNSNIATCTSTTLIAANAINSDLKTVSIQVNSASIPQQGYFTLISKDDASQTSDPLAVNLIQFTVSSENNSNVLKWKTGSEKGTLGYNILRSETKDGLYEKITDQIIWAKGSAIVGSDYYFKDLSIEPGKNYYYQLVDIDNNGNQIIHELLNRKDIQTRSETTIDVNYDADGNGTVDIGDVIFLLQKLIGME